MNKNLTLIIPAKYESESLPVFLDELSNFDYDKLVILDKNDKETIESINQFKNIKILHQKNKGYGAALIEGIKYCSTDYFCIINADGSMDPIYLNEMFNTTKNENLDFLFASRYKNSKAGSEDDSFITLLGNLIFSKLGNIFFSLKISDILFTYVLGKKKSFNELNLSSHDFTICVEFPIKAARNHYKLGCSPSFERSRIGGKKKVNEFKDGLLILIKMITLFFNR